MNGQITSLKATSDIDSQSSTVQRQSLPKGSGLFALLMADNGNVQSANLPQTGSPANVLTDENTSAKALADVLPQLSLKETPLSVTSKGVEGAANVATTEGVSGDEAQFLTAFGSYSTAEIGADEASAATQYSGKAVAHQNLSDVGAETLGADLPSNVASLASVQNTVKQVALAQGKNTDSTTLASNAKIPADVTQADMTQADMTQTDMTQTDMTQTDMTQTDMTQTDMTQTDMTQTDTTQTDTTQADVTQADVTQANAPHSDSAHQHSVNPVVEPAVETLPGGTDGNAAMAQDPSQLANSNSPMHDGSDKKTVDAAQQSAQSISTSSGTNQTQTANNSSSSGAASGTNQMQSSTQSSMSGQQGGQQNSQQGASQNPLFSYNAASGQSPQTQQKQFDRQSAAVKSFNDIAMAESTATDKAQKMLGDLGLGLDRKTQLPTSFQGIPFPVRSPQWGQALGQRVVYMASNKIQEAKITLNPEKLGPVQIRLHMDKDKQVHVAMSAHHATTKESMESAIPKLREMLGEAGIDFGDIDVSQDNSQFQGEETDDQSGHSASSNGGTALASDDEQSSQPVIIKTSDNLVDYYA